MLDTMSPSTSALFLVSTCVRKDQRASIFHSNSQPIAIYFDNLIFFLIK